MIQLYLLRQRDNVTDH